jgi:DnaJ-class molecular chaperone
MFARSSSRLCSMLHVNKYYSPASGSKKRLFNHIRGFSTRKRDYYDVLGLKKGANKAEIKKSYFEMAKKYHPDVNKEKGADAKFKEVTEAYECLENDEKRGLYDNFGHEAVDGSNGGGQGNPFAGGFGGFQGGFGGFNVNMQEGAHMEDIFDILNGAFGNTPRRDIQSRVSLSFFEAVNGCNKTLEVEYIVTTGSRGKQRRERKKKKVLTMTVLVNVPYLTQY